MINLDTAADNNPDTATNGIISDDFKRKYLLIKDRKLKDRQYIKVARVSDLELEKTILEYMQHFKKNRFIDIHDGKMYKDKLKVSAVFYKPYKNATPGVEFSYIILEVELDFDFKM